MISNLELARRKQCLTQNQLSKKSRVSRGSICNIEKRGIKNISVHTLQKLANALDTTVQELFFSDEE